MKNFSLFRCFHWRTCFSNDCLQCHYHVDLWRDYRLSEGALPHLTYWPLRGATFAPQNNFRTGKNVNWPVVQIPQCTSPISHNAPFCYKNVHICAHFCYKMMHCGIFGALWDCAPWVYHSSLIEQHFLKWNRFWLNMLGIAHFYPRPVLAFGYCHRLRLCVCPCVCVCVYQSLACPHDNSSAVHARITKFGWETQNTLVKMPIIFGGDRPWPSRSNLTWKSNFTSFHACPHDNFSLV